MQCLTHLQTAISEQPTLTVGIMAFISFFLGKFSTRVRLPSIIGFMVAGVVLGTSGMHLLNGTLQHHLEFITQLALGFVAVSIGLELDLHSLRRLGPGIVSAIFAESFGAFFLVLGGIYLLTHNLPLALIFAAVAPASAPAGTVAVIQEYRARGSLTKALYAVVGFDDGLGIIIFGFTAAAARCILLAQKGEAGGGLLAAMVPPLEEVFLSLIVGFLAMLALVWLLRKFTDARATWILTFSFVLILVGISEALHLSLILTNMIMGLALANCRAHEVNERIRHRLEDTMPLLFVLFFALAGAHLDLSLLPSLGAIGIVYILCRSAGLIAGASLGATLGGLESKIRRYLGLGILSQAGVAIGLSLIVANEFSKLGAEGELLGRQVLTTITATCIFFELVGPVLTKIGLERAGELGVAEKQ